MASFLDIALVLARFFLVQLKNHAPLGNAASEIQGVFGVAFGFLVWNLFLAWVPYVASLRFGRTVGPARIMRIGWFVLWLAFLPNAPYIVTDLIHLQYRPPIPIWYDMIMLFAFACTGLTLGLLSLFEIQRALWQQFSARMAQGIVFMAIFLSGFGVWLGRFQRWNSWDILTNPHGLFRDMAETLTHRNEMVKALGVSGLIASIVLFGYAFLATLLSTGRQRH